MKKGLQRVVIFIALTVVLWTSQVTVFAETKQELPTKEEQKVYSVGSYSNWDGVSNVCQFLEPNGELSFAFDGENVVTVVRTTDGVPKKKKVFLQKKHPLFGAVTCDSSGNYYLVTGEKNDTNDTNINTIFVSKYDSNGIYITTIGDNGSSSLASYYGSKFYTKIPFDAGNCDVAINGDILVINYAREMYSGHQSNSILAINIKTMTKVNIGIEYNSHSFAQRAIVYQDGFLFASEGDCYSRAFTVAKSNVETSDITSSDIFHFWVKQNTLKNWDMYSLNNNFAHMGGLTNINDRLIAFVATSAKSLNSDAAKENEQLFIQIMDPTKDLSRPESYVTNGNRSGLSGGDGDMEVTNYGIKWLTNYESNIQIKHPQVATDGSGNVVILFEKYIGNKYKGVYYKVINADGKTIKKTTCFSKKAHLNPSRMPVYSKGYIEWVSNCEGETQLYVFRLAV